jgi:hypothetical protein
MWDSYDVISLKMKQIITGIVIGMLIVLILVVAGYFFISGYSTNVIRAELNGYNLCQSDYLNNRAIPIFQIQSNGTDNLTRIVPLSVCSQYFQDNYKEICK